MGVKGAKNMSDLEVEVYYLLRDYDKKGAPALTLQIADRLASHLDMQPRQQPRQRWQELPGPLKPYRLPDGGLQLVLNINLGGDKDE